MRHTFQRILKQSIVLPAFLICSTTFALEPFQATYQVDYNGKPLGNAISSLKNTNKDEWDYSFSATAGDLINASAQSLFQYNNATIQPSSFNRNTKLFFFTTKNNIKFDTKNMTVITQDNKSNYSYPLENNVYDELNIELQIRDDLKNQQLKNEYRIAGIKKIKSVQLLQEGHENISTSLGTYETLKITMKHDDSNRQTTFWLAPSLDYLPVKALHIDKNFSYSILLNNYQKLKSD